MHNNINSTLDNQRNMLAGIMQLKTPLARYLMIEEINNESLKQSISKYFRNEYNA